MFCISGAPTVKNVQRQNVQLQNVKIQNVPSFKISQIQNVPSLKTSQATKHPNTKCPNSKMSQLQNILSPRTSQIQNIQSLKMSQSSKCPEPQNVQTIKCPNYKTSQISYMWRLYFLTKKFQNCSKIHYIFFCLFINDQFCRQYAVAKAKRNCSFFFKI